MATRKIDDRWCVEFQQGGSRIFRRLPAFASKQDAIALETRLRRELWERSALGRSEEPSLAAAVELWLQGTEPGRKDATSPRANAIHMAPYIGARTLREIGDAADAAIAEWSEDLAPATINRRLDVLRAAARYAWKKGWCADNLSARVPRLREENARQVYLDRQQIDRLAAKAPDAQTKAAIVLSAYTGLRVSELLALPAQKKGATALLVTHSKTGRPRQVPVHARARPYVKALTIGMPYRELIGRFWQAREAAGMPHVRWHDLRHTTASLLINAGVDLFTVGRILGHTSPATTARYAHLADAALHRAMRRVR